MLPDEPRSTVPKALAAYAAASVNREALAAGKRILAAALHAQYTDQAAWDAPAPCPCGCDHENPRQMAQGARRAEWGL